MKLSGGIWSGSLQDTVIIPNVYVSGGLIARSKGSLTKDRIMNDERMVLTKQNSFEFQGCSMGASKIIYLNNSFRFYALDNNLYFNNVVKMLKECQLLDTSSVRGERNISMRGKNLTFSNRDLSFSNSFNYYFNNLIISSIGSSYKTCTVTIPIFSPAQINPPTTATHLRLIFNLMWFSRFSYSEDMQKYVEVSGSQNAITMASSSYYDVSVGNAITTPLTWFLPTSLPSTPTTTSALLFASCVFYNYDGSSYNRISGNDNIILLKVR